MYFASTPSLKCNRRHTCNFARLPEPPYLSTRESPLITIFTIKGYWIPLRTETRRVRTYEFYTLKRLLDRRRLVQIGRDCPVKYWSEIQKRSYFIPHLTLPYLPCAVYLGIPIRTSLLDPERGGIRRWGHEIYCPYCHCLNSLAITLRRHY